MVFFDPLVRILLLTMRSFPLQMLVRCDILVVFIRPCQEFGHPVLVRGCGGFTLLDLSSVFVKTDAVIANDLLQFR